MKSADENKRRLVERGERLNELGQQSEELGHNARDQLGAATDLRNRLAPNAFEKAIDRAIVWFENIPSAIGQAFSGLAEKFLKLFGVEKMDTAPPGVEPVNVMTSHTGGKGNEQGVSEGVKKGGHVATLQAKRSKSNEHTP